MIYHLIFIDYFIDLWVFDIVFEIFAFPLHCEFRTEFSVKWGKSCRLSPLTIIMSNEKASVKGNLAKTDNQHFVSQQIPPLPKYTHTSGKELEKVCASFSKISSYL